MKKTVLPISDVYKKIKLGYTIEDVYIKELIELRELATKDFIDFSITFDNCEIVAFDAGNIFFNKQITLRNCIIKSASFYASYFLSGITIENCEFKNNIFLMSCGGHNTIDTQVIISNSLFNGYVDMFDAWFTGPVKITECNFRKGTNLLGNKKKAWEIQFDTEPYIKNNIGKLDLNDNLFHWDKKPRILTRLISKKKGMNPLTGYKNKWDNENFMF